MTVPSEVSSVSYSGNGTTTVFAIPFYFLENSHIKVILRSSTGSETTWVINVNFTLTGAGVQAGGTLTATVAPATGTTLVISRSVPATQETDYPANDPFPSSSHERALDKLTMIVQQNSAGIKGAIRVPDTDPEPARLPTATVRANLLLGFDSAGNPITVAPVSGSAADLATNLANTADVAKGAGQIGRGDQIVNSITELRALLKTSASKFAFANGYYVAGDGGGGQYYLDAADTTSADNGGTIIVATDGGRWKLIHNGSIGLSVFGGLANANGTASMNAALSAAGIREIIVPDGVTLGAHTFSIPYIRIIGGRNVVFSGAGAGFRPVDCNFVEISGFVNAQMSAVVADAHQFVSPGAGSDIGTIIIRDNTVSGGIGGAVCSFENGRTINKCYILYNEFIDQVGEDGGQGYGIQFANENTTGEAWLIGNRIVRAGRHSYYIARNKSNGRVWLIGNKAIDHRDNSTVTRGNFRPAFEIARSQNVFGIGNEVNGFYDGAFDVGDEPVSEQPVNPIQAHGIVMQGSVIKRPKNGLSAIRYGGQVPANDGLRGVHFTGVDFESDGIICPIATFNYGHDLRLTDVSARYKNISSGSILPVVFSANAAADSSDHICEGLTVSVTSSAGATCALFRIQAGAATAQVSIRVGNVKLRSNAGTNSTFSSAAGIDNLLIELLPGVDEDGLVFNAAKYLARTPFKSAPFNGRTSAASLTTPVGTFTPLFFGELFYLSDAAAKSFWMANGLTNADWVKIGP